MTEILDRFEAEYQRYNDMTEDRARQQQKTLRRFAEHAGRPLTECGGTELRAFMVSLVEQGLHVNTVRKYGNMVRPFFTWAHTAGLVPAEALMTVREVKNPRGATARALPRPYKAKQLKQLQADINSAYPELPEYRLRGFERGRRFAKVADHARRLQIEAVVGIALYCGLRRAELHRLTVDDAHYENAYVVVHGKGGRPREVPHCKRSRKLVKAWLDFRELLIARAEEPHDQLWLCLAQNVAEPGYTRAMSFQQFSELLSGVGDWQLHRLRHTCGTTWLRAGMPLEQVSKLLGHSSITMTLGYAEIVRDDLQRSVEAHEDTFDDHVNGDGDA